MSTVTFLTTKLSGFTLYFKTQPTDPRKHAINMTFTSYDLIPNSQSNTDDGIKIIPYVMLCDSVYLFHLICKESGFHLITTNVIWAFKGNNAPTLSHPISAILISPSHHRMTISVSEPTNWAMDQRGGKCIDSMVESP